MNEESYSIHAPEKSKGVQFTGPSVTVVEMPEVEEIRPVSIETVPYGAFKEPMVASTELFVKKHDLGLFHFHKVPPNRALVISGPLGTRVVTSRSTFVFPTEIANEINLEIIAVSVFEREIRTKDIYPVDIEAVVYFKISRNEKAIKKAAELLLSRSNEEVARMIQEIVNVRLREICATLSVDDLQDEMAQLNARVVETVQPDFEELGFIVKVFAVKHIVDRENFFQARAAETRAQLQIRAAEAKRTADMEVADARLQGERRKAEVQALLEPIWRSPELARYRCEQQLEMERAKKEMVASIVSEGLKGEVAERAKKVKQIQAEAEAIRIEELARAEASASRMKGEVEARVTTLMTQVFQGLDPGSLSLYLAERLPAVLSELASPLKNVDWKVFQTGGETGPGDSIAKTIQNILFSVIPVFQLFGLDLKGLLGSGKSGKNVEEEIQRFWSNLSPEKQKTLIEEVVSNLDKDFLRAIFQK